MPKRSSLEFENRTKKVSEKWPFEYRTVRYSVAYCTYYLLLLQWSRLNRPSCFSHSNPGHKKCPRDRHLNVGSSGFRRGTVSALIPFVFFADFGISNSSVDSSDFCDCCRHVRSSSNFWENSFRRCRKERIYNCGSLFQKSITFYFVLLRWLCYKTIQPFKRLNY